MRTIVKRTEPATLTTHRNTPQCDYGIEERIGYALDGTIRSDDPAFDRQLNDVLNLNLSRIKNERQGSLDGVLDWWRTQRRPVPTQRLERQVERRNSPAQFAPYVQVAVWWLERKLRERARRSD